MVNTFLFSIMTSNYTSLVIEVHIKKYTANSEHTQNWIIKKHNMYQVKGYKMFFELILVC